MSEKEQRNLIPRPDVTTPVLGFVTKIRGGKPVSDIWRKRWHIHTFIIRHVIRGFWFLFNRKMLQRYAFALACLATLTALVYVIENWRGKSAWQKHKTVLEAKGVTFDWNTYIANNPQFKVVADREKAFLVRSAFQRSIPPTNTIGFRVSTLPSSQLRIFKDYPADYEAIAAVRERGLNEISADKLRALGGQNITVDIQKHLHKGLYASLAELASQCGLTLDNNSKAVISNDVPWLREEMVSHWKDFGSLEILEKLLRMHGFTLAASIEAGKFQLKPDISKVTLREWFDASRPWMGKLIQALQSPGHKLDLDFGSPQVRIMQNFVAIRTLAQTFSTGAELALADGRIDDVWFYLNGLEGLMNFTAEPPYILISTMIEETIAVQYMEIIEAGWRVKAFSKSDLKQIRNTLKDMNLIHHFSRSVFDWERLSVIYSFENLERIPWASAFDPDIPGSQVKGWIKFAVLAAPRGWYYQNLLKIHQGREILASALNSEHRTVNSEIIEEYDQQWKKEMSRYPGPFNILELLATPYYGSAFQTLAVNQSRLHTSIIVCALEEYRLEQGEYPDDLKDLTPKYLTMIPNDVIDGRPMRYRREAKDSFVLYSIGWNRKDESGLVKVSDYPVNVPKLGFTFYSKDRTQGDWVFRSKPLVAP